MDGHYLGRLRTPYWTDAGDTGPIPRVGSLGESEARINHHDFQASWNGQLESGGVVVSDAITINLDVEALLETDLKTALAMEGQGTLLGS